MSLLEELLAPIEGDTPVGPELRGSNEFAAIETAFQEAEQPANLIPAGASEEDGGQEFQEVVELATDFLRDQSKDLKVAVLLTVSLLRVEGFPGLATGLELIKGLLEAYWDDLHPPLSSRGPILDWMGSDDVSYALYLAPLTEFGDRFSDYKEWVKGAGDESPADEEDGSGEVDFGSAFNQTSRDWYEDLSGALHRCNAALSELDALGKERFGAAGETPPRYASIADALKKMTAAGDDLLGRKPAPPKSKMQLETSPEDGAGASHAVDGTNGQTPSSGPPVVVSAEPETAFEATKIIAVAARVLRRERPGDPAGYLLPRALRWGELRAGGEHVDPRILEAPTTSQRTHLKSLFLDKRYEELLEAGEELMATPVGRGWLDLQRYAILSTDKLGQSHRQVSNALRSAVSSLLRDLPALIDASLMDDSPTASRDTLSWLESEGLLLCPEPEGRREEKSRAAEADRIIKEAGFDRAAAMAQTGDPEGAVEMLMERAEHERSERDRFLAKTEAVRIMVDHDMSLVARPILDEIVSLIEKHQLEEWEPAEVVAKPIGLLIRCLDPESESSLKNELYPRLAKLDPLLAMQVSRIRTGSNQGGTPATGQSGSEDASISDAAPGDGGETDG